MLSVTFIMRVLSNTANWNFNKSLVNTTHCRYWIILLLLSLAITTHAQREAREVEGEEVRRRSSIIDDSTKVVYGPHTTLRFTEEELFYNRLVKEPLDTNIWDFHRYAYIQRLQNKYQDLGNNGTAMYPIFLNATRLVGASDGYYVYDLFFDRNPIEYLDTKSPYSYMDIVLGGNGRSMTEVGYSRNVNPQWNFGFDFKGIFSDRQLLRTGRGERQVGSNYYDFNTSHMSENGRYKLLANLKRMNHKVREIGGVNFIDGDDDAILDQVFSGDAQPRLNNTNTIELRTNLHLYQEYSLKEFFQVYHRFDREKRQNRFQGPNEPGAVALFNYLNPNLDSARASDRTKFVSFQNEVGIKGSLWRIFYNGFIKVRTIDFSYNHLNRDTLGIGARANEFYLGGRGGILLNNDQYLEAEAEVMQEGNYRIQAVFKTKIFEATVHRSLSKPGFIHQAYRGAHSEWFNNFNDTDYSTLNAQFNLKYGRIGLSPGVKYTDIGNYIFYKEINAGADQRFAPIQSAGRQRILSPSLNYEIEVLKKVFFRGEIIYSEILDNADNAIQLPKFFANAQLAYRHDVPGKNIGYHFGVDVHWRSAYYAMAYATPIQQFYVQEQFLVPAFPLIDPFFNLKMRRARIFLRYHNSLAALSKHGFMQTPFYNGMGNIADFGFNWMFFD
jgi:hypothetical protein